MRYERYGIQWPSFNLHWFAEEAVETEVKTEESVKAPDLFSVDDIIIDDEQKSTEKKDDEVEIEIEGKDKISKEVSEVKELKKQIAELQGDLLKLSTTKREERPKEEPKKEKLTKPQLVAILKEHKDDPEVLLNVAEYLAEQKAEEIRDTTMKDVNHRQWHSNLSGMANRILAEDEDGYLAANPKVKPQLRDYATNLGLGDHPIGELAAYAILRLSQSAKAKDSKDDKSIESNTNTNLNKGKLDKTRLTHLRSKDSGLNQEQMEMAKRFGVKPETYAKFVGRK